jgi:hypothetical protein
MNDDSKKPKIGPHIAALLRDEEWALTSAKLTNYAHKRMGRRSMERAQEIAQEAITRLYDGEYAAWDPEKEPSLFLFLTSIVNSLAYGDRIKSANNKEARVKSKKQERAVARIAAPEASPEEEVVARDLQKRMWTEIRANVAGDARVNDLADLVEDGIDAPAEQAAKLGVSIEEVRTARRRFFTQVEKVARAFTEEP